MNGHPESISSILGRLVQTWTRNNPEALRAIKKVNDASDQFLFKDPQEKLKYIQMRKLRNYKCQGSNQTIDLVELCKDAPALIDFFA